MKSGHFWKVWDIQTVATGEGGLEQKHRKGGSSQELHSSLCWVFTELDCQGLVSCIT